MNDSHALDTTTPIAAGEGAASYDGIAIALHWITAFLVIANFTLGVTWDWFARPVKQFMESTHMSFGVLLTVAVLARIVWQLIPGHRIASLEAGWTRLAARATHYLLYALLVAEAALGFIFRWGAGRPMTFFGTGIPPLIGEIARPDRRLLRELHEWIGWTIAIVALGHALYAFYHHYVLKDRVLARMLPRGTRHPA